MKSFWIVNPLSHEEIAALFRMPSSNSVAQTIRGTKVKQRPNSESFKEIK
jgi:hypothetical protein